MGDVTIEHFDEGHLAGVLALCREQGWPSLPADADRALRALGGPGVTTCVALDGRGVDGPRVVGFAQLLSDGEIQAFLALLLVAPGHRRRGIGRRLVAACVTRAGGLRVDLLAEEDAKSFYDSFSHRSMPGYRIYVRPDLDA